ncbi:6-bladed beta-propeller [Algoriphagus sp. C2-6-M1]|uniref:6-bladed beta-propeller n=1 Tax=Algoriphagus persicinus TaxID=3108754 RepID=UPI002B36CDBD|nr:6-bladed beta-propeller [Algoriphagus sp. C2-6-M1]MEB2781214.1 6-bladed beta-propeller [Algoriphagus sp. C2-6-M1]
MKFAKLTLLFLIVSLLQSCNNKGVDDKSQDFKTIEISRDFFSGDSPGLQIEILDTINLEAPGNPSLTSVQDIAFSQGFFLILDNRQGLLKFDNSGSFLQKIGEMGEGPDEYSMPYAIHLDDKEKVVLVLDWQKRVVISYDLEGTFDSSSQRLPGQPISFYKNNDTLLVVQETLIGTKEKPRQVLVSSIEPKTLDVKHWERPLYGYHSDYTSIHSIPRILSRVKNTNLFYMPIIRDDISSHSDTDTIFRKEEDHLVPEYLINLTGFDNTQQLAINHVVMSDSYAFLRVVYENRIYHAVIDLVNNRPLIHLKQLFDREVTGEIIPRQLNGDIYYSIVRNEEGVIEKNPMIVMYRLPTALSYNREVSSD